MARYEGSRERETRQRDGTSQRMFDTYRILLGPLPPSLSDADHTLLVLAKALLSTPFLQSHDMARVLSVS